MAKEKKYKRCGEVHFKEPVDITIYQQVRRSANPIKKAIELEILDMQKIKEFIKEYRKEIIVGFFLGGFVTFLT